MAWTSIIAGIVKAFSAFFKWLSDKQLLDAGGDRVKLEQREKMDELEHTAKQMRDAATSGDIDNELRKHLRPVTNNESGSVQPTDHRDSQRSRDSVSSESSQDANSREQRSDRGSVQMSGDWKSWEFKVIDPLKFVVPQRKITKLYLHCSASDLAFMKGVMLVDEINRWHLANGWAGVGYHECIDKDGNVISARPIEMQGSAQLGRDKLGNIGAMAICVHGHWEFTEAAMEAVVVRCKTIDAAFKLENKEITFHGHCEIDPRPCPVFDYGALLGLDQYGHLFAIDGVEPAEIAKRATRVGK